MTDLHNVYKLQYFELIQQKKGSNKINVNSNALKSYNKTKVPIE